MPNFTTVKYVASCNFPLLDCGPVSVCLTDEWAGRTQSGYALANATIVGSAQITVPETVGCVTNYCSTACEYSLEFDRDAEFLTDPSTGEPWEITTDDIVEMIPYPCLVDKLVEAIKFNADWVIDSPNVVQTVDTGTQTFTVNIPIIDRVNGTPQGNVFLDLSALFDNTYSTMTQNVPAGQFTFTPPVGAPTIFDVCDLMQVCVDGSTITRTGAGGTYEANFPPGATIVSTDAGNLVESGTDSGAFLDCDSIASCIAAPNITFASADTCGSGGVGPDYAVKSISAAGEIITINGANEHLAMSEEATFAVASASTAPQIASLGVTPSPYFVSNVFNNPSNCRVMRGLVIGTGSFALSATPASGFIVLGHSLYINGVVVATRDGRTDAGYNISWSDHVTGVLHDFTLPSLVYPVDIPAGGSVTIGMDFGLSNVFVSLGTIENVSIEARSLNFIGSTI